MTRKYLYEFNGFRIDPLTRILTRNEKVIPLSAKRFELLLGLVENHGHTVAKEDLIKRVWPNTTVMDRTFHVTLAAVRKAIGERGSDPHYIRRTVGGYEFVADVRQ